jgi:hypothetical protein
MTVKAVWHIVKESARRIGVVKLAPHDLRRTCARLCHASGGELEQIQFLWGTFRFKRPNDILAASSGFDQPSMIALALSRILELGVGCGRVADHPPGTVRGTPSAAGDGPLPFLFGCVPTWKQQAPMHRKLTESQH